MTDPLTASYQNLLDQLDGLPAPEVIAIITGQPLTEAPHDIPEDEDEDDNG